jgi:hypothetical protein
MCAAFSAAIAAAGATSVGELSALTRTVGRISVWKKVQRKQNVKIGTRKEWLAARLELLQAEKEHTRRGDKLALMRQELPWVLVDKEYRFETEEGAASLSDLFQGRSQLLIYHFMFGPDYTAGRPVLLGDCGRIQWLPDSLG